MLNKNKEITGVAAVTKTGFMKEKSFVIIRENRKIIIQFIVTVLFFYMAAWFISHEKTEIQNVKNIIAGANIYWVMAGILLVFVYILLRGMMYVTSFASINLNIKLRDSVLLFLKRNFISVFLPAGGITSLVFFTSNVERNGITKSQIFYASSINAFVSILSVVLVAIPAFLFVVSGGKLGNGRWLALGATIVILLAFLLFFYSLVKKTKLYNLTIKIFPRLTIFIEEMSSHRIKAKPFLYTLLLSVIVEVTGIAHVYISMIALGLTPSFSIAIISYIVVIIFLVISPFLRGLGAIEVSMTYVLMQYGLSDVHSIAVTMLFRFFEFWIPLLTGLLSFLLKVQKLFLRILPAVLILALGIVNIISVLTPALPERLDILRNFLDIISFSNSFVLVTGMFLMLTATFMLRGLRTSWWIALGLSIVSMIGHITKGIDYEEAFLALVVIGALLATRKEYYIRSNPRLGSIGFQTALMSMVAVMLIGVSGFYFLDPDHFHINFNIAQSFRYTFQIFFLMGSRDLVPSDTFASDFLNLIRISGVATMAFLIYTLVRPYIFKAVPTDEEKTRAAELVKRYGKSSLDYFKTYNDKLIFAPGEINAFISFRVSRSFAVVLEDPVSENNDEMQKCIIAFSQFCYENGLKDIYYRVPKESLPVYHGLSKKILLIGQEAVVDLYTFTLDGGEKKSIRNALNKIKEQGYTIHINTPPLLDGLVQKLKAVSEDWLKLTGRQEIGFSQGYFNEEEIKHQTVITVENREEMVIAFLNIIPDYVKNEGTYDLQRKTFNAPNGIMDFILVELFRHFRNEGFRYVNLGFAPMSGVDDPHTFPERSLKFAYEKIRSFSQYKGLREYKEKFNPAWNDKFLIYSNDYDLLQIPAILSRVIKI